MFKTTLRTMNTEMNVEGKDTTLEVKYLTSRGARQIEVVAALDGNTDVLPFIGYLKRKELQDLAKKDMMKRVEKNVVDCINNRGELSI